MNLPKTVVEKDRTLSKAADELMQLRWHWTLDESNSKRVSFAEYARQVGRSDDVIGRDANAWEAYRQSLKTAGPGGKKTPGAAQQGSNALH
jgi:hypothetical protein